MSIGKISKRPNNISKESTSFESTEKFEKLPAGPTMPRPGPILLRQAIIAVVVDSRSKPSNESKRTEPHMIARYATIYAVTPDKVSSETTFPFILTRQTARGWIMRRVSFFTIFPINNKREILIPPPVEPAHAPTNIKSTRIILEKLGQRLKSAAAKLSHQKSEDYSAG